MTYAARLGDGPIVKLNATSRRGAKREASILYDSADHHGKTLAILDGEEVSATRILIAKGAGRWIAT